MTWQATSPIAPLQNAIYSRLTIGGHKISYSVYDEVPSGATYPYVTFGNPTAIPFEARNVMGQRVRFPFNIHSRDVGGKWECQAIIDAIIQSITADVLTITGYKCIKMDFITSRIERLEDGISYSGELDMEFWVVKA
jgi:hypothetical protein